MRALQVAVDRRDVDVGRRQPAPGQVEDGVEQAADHGDLGAHRRRLPELACSSRSTSLWPPARDGPRRAGGRTRRSLRRRLSPRLLDLVADHAQLLVQEQLALRALDALLHLGHDLLLDAEHGVLLGQQLRAGRGGAPAWIPSPGAPASAPRRPAGARPRCRRAPRGRASGSTTSCTSSASCGLSCT